MFSAWGVPEGDRLRDGQGTGLPLPSGAFVDERKTQSSSAFYRLLLDSTRSGSSRKGDICEFGSTNRIYLTPACHEESGLPHDELAAVRATGIKPDVMRTHIGKRPPPMALPAPTAATSKKLTKERDQPHIPSCALSLRRFLARTDRSTSGGYE